MTSDDLNTNEEIQKEATGPVGRKPILCLDFDGVIHDYKEGWKEGQIYGHTTPGFWEWALAAKDYFELHIFSSRSGKQYNDMYGWMRTEYGIWIKDSFETPEQIKNSPSWEQFGFVFDRQKPPAFITIDDRAITFQGDWSQLNPEVLRGFKPWNAK